MFKIGEFSRISQVPAKTLRYYDEIGLFSPKSVDQSTGYRYYSASQLQKLNRILVLKDFGLGLSEIRYLLEEETSLEELKGMFRLKEVEARQQAENAQTILNRIRNRLHQIEIDGMIPEYDVIIKEIPPQRVISIRQVAHKAEDVGNHLGELAMSLYASGHVPTAEPFTIFYDPELQNYDMDIETVIPVAQSSDICLELGQDRVATTKTIPKIEFAACVVHQGDYDNFDKPYAALGHWIEKNNFKIIDAPREVYLSPPQDDQLPITEIQYPLTKIT